MAQARPDISAVLITCNDAARIRPCLDSIRWVDEIVVVDLQSADDTVAICREYTDKVHSHAWLPYCDPIRDEVIARAEGPWILMLDPDERVTPELAAALRSASRDPDLQVVLIPFWFMVLGRRRVDDLATSDAIPRFFRQGVLSWPPTVHARPDVSSLRCKRLDAADGHYVLHDGWRTTDEILDKIARYTLEEARTLQASGAHFRTGRAVRETLLEIVRGLAHGFHRAGVAGMLNIGFSAFYRLTVWARLWELEGGSPEEDRQAVRLGNAWGWLPRLALRLRGRTGRR